MTIRTKDKHIRNIDVDLQTRSENDELVIEGYFSVFNSVTELFPGAYEEIAPGAFDNTLDNDIRALINHNTALVLGRNKSGTLELETDSKGLFGRIKINENDTDAMNLYERVKRGDVHEGSCGFNIFHDDAERLAHACGKLIVREIDLDDVTVVRGAGYAETSVQSSTKQKQKGEERKIAKQKIKQTERLDSV